ncbi:glutamate--tRNA ligase family protein, partial [Streptomyces griseoluteus]
MPCASPGAPAGFRGAPGPAWAGASFVVFLSWPGAWMVRTALFNWAFARHHEGTLVFRIEDTDAARDS